MTNLDILRKIRGLMAKAKDNAASDNEVYIFMSKAQELMAKHKINESDLELSKDEITSKYFDTYVIVFDQINSYVNREYLSSLAYLITTNNFCKTVYNNSVKEFKDNVVYYDRIRFIGKIDDINNTLDLFQFSYRKFLTLAKIRYAEAKRVRNSVGGFKFKALNSYQPVDRTVFYRSYLKGTLKGLEEKYDENKLNLNQNQEYGLIVSNYKHSIDDFINNNIGRITSSSQRDYKSEDDNAFELGKNDAKTNIQNQLKS